MLRNKPKSITFKQAFIITIGLHVLGFCGIYAFSAYRTEKRKEYALAKKTYREQLMQRNSSDMFPKPVPLKVVAQSPVNIPVIDQVQPSPFIVGTVLNTINDLAFNTNPAKTTDQHQITEPSNKRLVDVNHDDQPSSSILKKDITVSKTSPTRVLQSANRFFDALKGVEFDLQSGPKTLQSPTIAHKTKSPAIKAKELQEFKNATEDLKSQFLKAKKQIVSEVNSESKQTKRKIEETKNKFLQTQTQNKFTEEIIKEEIIRRVVDSRIVL